MRRPRGKGHCPRGAGRYPGDGHDCPSRSGGPLHLHPRRGLELSPLNPILLLPRVLLERETGESGQGEVYLERPLEAMSRARPIANVSRASMAIIAVARITGVPNRLEISEAATEAFLSEQSVNPDRALQAKAALALLAVPEGYQSSPEDHCAYLLGHRGTMIGTEPSADRLLGLLSQTMGNMGQATSHFELLCSGGAPPTGENGG